jgi:N-methylhydantoinase B
MEFRPGDVLTIRVPGGGGVGDPRQREPDRVRADVSDGIVSARAAREIYGVEVNEG